MKVTVKLFATLRKYNEKILELDLVNNFSCENVLNLLEIPINEVSIIMVNGKGVSLEHILIDEDTVAFFPPVGGG
jgi:molybdopterin converting factor small subunit